MTSPNAALTAAAISAAPKLKRSDATTRGAHTTAQKCPRPEPKLRMNVADSGISTSSDRYTMVYPSVSPNPGMTLRLLAIDPIEGPIVCEMSSLRLRPTAECTVDGHERDVRKLFRILRGDIRIARTIEMLGGNFLPFLGIQVAQIFFGDLARAMLVDHLVDDGHRRLREDAQRGRDHVELVGTQLLHCEIRFVLPGQQNVADSPFHESHRGPSG